MKFDILVENYLETLLEGRPKTDHSKEISLDFDDIENYIEKMSDDNLSKPIYSKILEFLKQDNEENRFTVSKIKSIIENNLKHNFDKKSPVEFNANEFIKFFIKERKSFSPFEEKDDEDSTENESSEDENSNEETSEQETGEQETGEQENSEDFSFDDSVFDNLENKFN
jgi:hypothetical protein